MKQKQEECDCSFCKYIKKKPSLTFEINDKQLKKLNKWIKDGNRTASRATTGERLEYCFMPCGLGMHIVVRDCRRKEEINLSDYENW